MNRLYELGLVTEPRQTEDEVKALTDRLEELIRESGCEVFHLEDWGKKKLAYPIRKFNEGKYAFLYVSAREGNVPPWPQIERLLQQDERILRHLVVRTDEDLKRALRNGKVKPEVPGMTAEELHAYLDVPYEGEEEVN